MPECISCGKVLTPDEIGATKKLINRGAQEFFCLSCLAKRYKVEESLILQKIEEWRAQGCGLFTQ